MTMPAIPTTYNGVNYRSRLEARWAYMFDLLRIRHQYEPLDGPGYIPDFIIDNRDEHVLVEVKPALDINGLIDEMVRLHQLGVPNWWNGGILILGAAPYFGPTRHFPLGAIGLWDHARFGAAAGRFPTNTRWHTLDNGATFYAKSSYCRHADTYGVYLLESGLNEYWKRAGNAVQWQPHHQASDQP